MLYGEGGYIKNTNDSINSNNYYSETSSWELRIQ